MRVDGEPSRLGPRPSCRACAKLLEMETFEGVVHGEARALVFADATMRIGKKKHVERVAKPSFALALEDGTVLQVEGVEAAEKEGRVVLRGPYGELLESPIVRLFQKRAPGDHIDVEVIGFALAVGERVRVVGEVVAHANATTPGDEGGMREAPLRVPSVVRASRLIIEGNAPWEATPKASAAPSQKAESTVEATQSQPRAEPSLRPLQTSTRVFAVLGAALTLGSLAMALRPLEAWRNWLSPAFSLGLVCLAIALVRHLRGVHHAPIVSLVRGASLTSNPVWGYAMDVPVFVIGFGLIATFPALESQPGVVAVFALAAALLVLAHAFIVLAQEHAFRRFGRLVLSAKPASAEGRMGSVAGTFTGKPLSREVTFVETTHTYNTTDKDGHTVERETTKITTRVASHGERFDLKTTEGDVRIESKGAQVAFAERHWRTGRTARYVEGGSEALVLGRKQEGAIEAGGDESLFIWVGSRASLMRCWLMAYLRPLGFIALAGAFAWVAFHVMPFADAWHFEGTSEGQACSGSLLRYAYNSETRCSVSLTCGGVSLYGGFGMGQMPCSMEGGVLTGVDEDPTDGDAALRISVSRTEPGRILWSTEGGFTASGTREITLDRATLTFVH